MFVTNGNIQLHYLAHGNPSDATPIILLPGLTANAQSFNGLIAAGLAHERAVYALDFRGRGLSDKPTSGYTMADYVTDVIALMDALALDSAIIVGHSFGALVGMVLAVEHPQRVEKFVIIDSSHLLINERTANMIKGSLDRLGKRIPSLEMYLNGIRQMPYLGGFWDESVEAYFRADVEEYADGSVVPRTSADAIAQTIDAEFEIDWDAIARSIRQPCLLVHAQGGYIGAEPILPQNLADETVAILSKCDYAPMSANHITMIFGENAVELVEKIQHWERDHLGRLSCDQDGRAPRDV